LISLRPYKHSRNNMVQHKQTIEDFVKALSEYVQNGMSGSVVIMGQEDAWGKVVIEMGELVSLTYGVYRGPVALPELKKIVDIRFMFRPDKNNVKKFSSPGSARICNEDFFSFFGLKIPRVTSGTLDGMSSMTTSNSKPLTQTLKPGKDIEIKGRVLIIDDSAIARRAAADPLLERGFEIIEAKDGFDALGKLESIEADLIILDLIMPGMDGYKVVDLLKRNDKYKSIPIILVTSKDSLMDKLKGKMSDTDAYITKPFKEGELLTKVIGIFNKQR